MSNYTDEMRFALFKNDKQGNEKRPDYRGTCQIGGVKYKLSGWKRTRKETGETFLSGQIQAAEESNQQQAPAEQERGNDDVPF